MQRVNDGEALKLIINGDDGQAAKKLQQTNFAQNTSKFLYQFVNTAALSTTIYCTFIPSFKDGFLDTMTKSAIIISGITVIDAMHALTIRKHPFANNFCSKLAAAFAIAIPFAVDVGLIGNINRFNNDTICDPKDAKGLLLSSPFQHPLVQMSLLSFANYASYKAVKHVIGDCIFDSTRNEEYGQNILQKFGLTVMQACESLALSEALRSLFIGLDHTEIAQHPYFSFTAAAFYPLLRIWNHMSMVPKPIDHIVPEEKWPNKDIPIDEFLDLGGEVTKTSPSYSSIAAHLAYATIRLGIATFGGSLAGYGVYNYVNAQSEEDMLTSRDQMLKGMAIVGATGAVDVVLDLAAVFTSKVTSCCQTFFSFSPKTQNNPVDDYDYSSGYGMN